MALGGLHRRPGAVRRSASSASSTPCSRGGRDVIKEAEHGGYHTRVVQISHRYGMIMFIASEVMFFVAWFWAYFDASIFRRRGQAVRALRRSRRALAAERHRRLRSLPPAAAEHADPADLGHDGDLGASRAAAQRPRGPEVGPDPDGHARRASSRWCRPTSTATPLSRFKGNIYGATFFMATGFHGFHVLIGTIFLLVCLVRALTATSRRSSISASNSPPGTGTSSTWCGCSCSSRSICGAPIGAPRSGPPPGRTEPPHFAQRAASAALCHSGIPAGVTRLQGSYPLASYPALNGKHAPHGPATPRPSGRVCAAGARIAARDDFSRASWLCGRLARNAGSIMPSPIPATGRRCSSCCSSDS